MRIASAAIQRQHLDIRGQVPLFSLDLSRPTWHERRVETCNMATLHAGVKRSFQDMRGVDVVSPRSSAKDSIHRTPTSRQCSATPTPSGAQTPIHGLEALQRRVSFPTDASVLLIGVRGVGKARWDSLLLLPTLDVCWNPIEPSQTPLGLREPHSGNFREPPSTTRSIAKS